MGALSAAASWVAEDDFLLKSAVEAGASLESLAKGAVCFSRKFTLQELQDRWCSLLYDSETSAQASTRIIEYETELSISSPAKAIKIFNSKAKGFSFRKRKIDSVKHQYYSKRKRVCHEPCLSADFGYVIAPCSCITVGSGCVCSGQLKPSEGHHLVNKIDPAADYVNSYGDIDESYGGGQDVHGQDNRNYVSHTNAAGSMFIDGNANVESLHGCSDADQLFRCDYIHERGTASEKDISDPEDYLHLQEPLGDQYGNVATGSMMLSDTDQDGIKQNKLSAKNKGRLQVPGSFKAIRQQSGSRVPGVSSPDMMKDMHRKEQEILTLSYDMDMETTNGATLACPVNIYDGVSGSALDNVTVSESGFMHTRSMDCNQTEDFEILNGKNVAISALDTCREDLGDARGEVVLKDISGVHLLGVFDSAVSNTCSNHMDQIHNKHNAEDVCEKYMLPTSSEAPLPDFHIECRLNTEDYEIPGNDDAMIHGQLRLEGTSTRYQNSEHNMSLVSNKSTPPRNADDSSHTNFVADVQPSPTPTKMETSTAAQKENMVAPNEDCKPSFIYGDVGANNANMFTSTFHPAREVPEETTCDLVREGFVNLRNLTLNAPIRVPDQMNCKFVADKTDTGCGTAIRNCISPHELPNVEFHNPIAAMSSSDQAEGGSDNENSVPNYLDIEALILDQDLIPWGQESDFIQPVVSRFQHLECRKDLVRLEQSAHSYTNRSIISRGAFAILYGQHLKCYIKDPEVTLGRKTEEVHVDIDLGKEGNANKISRRQAVIKMDERGSFLIKNIGRCSIFVNGKEVPCNKCMNLNSDALLEIRGMKFIFHVNPDAVRQHVLRAKGGSFEGEQTEKLIHEWDQNP